MRFKPDWKQAQQRFRLWWAGEETDRPLLQVTAPRLDREPLEWSDWEFAKNPHDPEPLIERFARCCEGIYFGGEAFPNLWPNLGPGIVGAHLGAQARFRTDTVWFETPRPWEEIGDLTLDEENFWWERTKRITQAAVEQCDDRYFVALTDLGLGLDILASLRGTLNLCRDLHDHPARVDWARTRIRETWHRCYEELQAIIETRLTGSSTALALWCPGHWYLLHCDFSAMISPQMFERFVAPDLQEDCRRLGHAIYHLDSPRQIPHLDILLEIEELDGIQWVPGAGQPGTDSRQWMPLYRRIQAKGKRLVLCGVRPENALAIVGALHPKGLLLTTACRSPEEAQALVAEVSQAACGGGVR